MSAKSQWIQILDYEYPTNSGDIAGSDCVTVTG